MTTKVTVINEGPGNISVEVSYPNGADAKVLEEGERTEKYVYSGAKVVITEDES